MNNDKIYCLYEYGYLKDIFTSLDAAIDSAEHMYDTYSCHIEEHKEDSDIKEMSNYYNWTNHPFEGDE